LCWRCVYPVPSANFSTEVVVGPKNGRDGIGIRFVQTIATGYDWVGWLEIRLDDDEIKSYVISKLKEIHVPGEIDGNVVRVYGYKDGFVDYI
jgi:hypothetical protein